MYSLFPRVQSNDGRTIILFQVSFYASNLLGGHGDVENDFVFGVLLLMIQPYLRYVWIPLILLKTKNLLLKVL